MERQTVLTLGELVERTGIEQETIERLVHAGLVRPGGKASSGTPYFTGEMAERIAHIRGLLEMGYGEDEAAKILRKIGPPHGEKRGGERASDEHLLTVGALAESVGVSPRTIKHWEDKGIIDADARSEGGFRLYREHYVYLCNLIQDLQLFGYSLDQIKQVSDYFRDFVVMRDELAHYSVEEADVRLRGMLTEIDGLFERTAKLRSGIERWEKLLNKHRKLIADLKRANDKRS